MKFNHFVAADDSSTPDSASRRAFLKAAGIAGGGLVVGFSALPVDVFATPAASKQVEVNPYVTIARDGTVYLTMSRVEMGQGVYTSLPMLIAEELEVDVDKVVLLHAPPNVKVYGAPIGDQFTGGSLTIRTMWQPMRQTGAAARVVLIEAAAKKWRVPVESCRAERGQVIHEASGRRLGYGDLVEAAAQIPAPEKVVLKTPDQFKLIGKPAKRLDAKGKVDGSAVYGMDVILPGMVFASVAQSPVFGGKLKSVDESKARAIKGVRDVVKLSDAVAVIADNTWYARQGVAALGIEWDDGANANLSTDDIRTMMRAGLSTPGVVARNKGDAAKVVADDPKRVEETYINQMLSHSPMEPMNCTVHVKPDSAEIWVGTQVPARAQAAVAKLLGLPQEKVTLHGHLIGGAFGRRLYHDYVEQAAAIGRQVKGPVKVVWTREEDTQHSVHRGTYAHRVSASVGADGYPVALYHKFAGPSNLATFAPSFFRGDVDIDAVEGSENYPYDIPNMRTEYTRVDGPVPAGFWRGVGPTRNVLVLESFMDQLAYQARKDPLDYRLALLKTDKRAAHVVARAAELAGWGSTLPPRTGRGIALMNAWGMYLAQVVELSVTDSGDITVHRVVCVVDCGIVIHEDGVIAQMQGGINFGLSAAMYGDITVKNGRVEQSNFHDYPVIRMQDAPQIVVEVVKSGEAPGGIGETATAGVGPAFVNAVFQATGVRIHQLPARPEQLQRAKAAA